MTTAAPHTRTASAAATVSPRARLVGRVVTGLVVAFLLFDAGIHLANIQPVRDSMAEYGFPDYAPYIMGVVMLACLALYLVPVTSILGAVLLTGYLGGAVACNILTEQPLLSTILSPVYVGIFVWGGLYLRDARVRAIMPLVRD
ncbi:DoxX family protein [Prescottella agglutinans]|uniref:DoxX family protein n=1 Tax=Prescottella agglutinans TaxID=1644129 RepID=A0A3S3AGC3_9NOCA|nr:DoxX family protein [Prescottella agglutinans]RVW09419.1 DoxX family protein [Prescottella agglutinans]